MRYEMRGEAGVLPPKDATKYAPSAKKRALENGEASTADPKPWYVLV